MRLMVLAALTVGRGLAPHAALAQQPAIQRTDLQRHDLSAAGREAIQVRVGFDPGAAVPCGVSVVGGTSPALRTGNRPAQAYSSSRSIPALSRMLIVSRRPSTSTVQRNS